MTMTEVSSAILGECRDPKKALSDNVTSMDGQFCWGETTEEEHLVCIGKNATNNPAESPFALLTCQLQIFGHVLDIQASAVGHDRINGDFKRNHKDSSDDGAYFKLSPNERES